jgi:branched-chain amino acid transport system permease protein
VQDEVTQLFLEQALNGLQFGLMLFLLAAGLTLVFGIMDCINLAHGSLYMVGAYFVAAAVQAADSFWIGLGLGVAGTALVGLVLELSLFRRLYRRDHLSQVLATFALILIANEAVRVIWGAQPVLLNPPESLAGPVEIGDFSYPAYRWLIIGFGLVVALGPGGGSSAGSAAAVAHHCLAAAELVSVHLFNGGTSFGMQDRQALAQTASGQRA